MSAPREVMGIPGEILVLGPEDMLVVRVPKGYSDAMIFEVREGLRSVIGDRFLIVTSDFHINVKQGESNDLGPQ